MLGDISFKRIDQEKDALILAARKIWENPESGYNEFIASDVCADLLEEAGFEVESAPDGTDAVAMVKKSEENYYDVILMDVQMPIMNGYEATRTIRNLPRKDVRTLPIIAMTANALEEDKEAALKNGMNAHLSKPIDVDLFIEVLKQYTC